jgi:hypothetical protein
LVIAKAKPSRSSTPVTDSSLRLGPYLAEPPYSPIRNTVFG